MGLEPGGAAFSDVLHLQGAVVVDRGREQQGEQEAPVPRGVKDAARDQEEDVLSFERQHVVDAEHDAQEHQEREGIEEHGRPGKSLVWWD